MAWIRRTFGYSTLIYLVFWLALFVVGGVQSAAPLAHPLPRSALQPALDALALLALASVLLQRSPPVVMGRPLALQLGLAPQPARAALRPRMAAFLASRALVGGVVGTMAWLLVAILFDVSTPWLVLLGAALWVLRASLAWMHYVRAPARTPLLLAALLLAAVGLAAGVGGGSWQGYGIAQGALGTGVPPLVAPALALLAAAFAWVRLGPDYLAGYLHDCAVVSEFRSALLFAAMTQSPAALRRGRGPLARSKGRRGRRSGRARVRLAPPPAAWGALGAVAWRSSLRLLRSSLLAKAALLAALAYVYATLAAGVHAGLPLALLGLAAGFLASWLVGPDLQSMPTPVDPLARGVGRTLPGLGVAAAAFAIFAVVRAALQGDASGVGVASVLAFGLVALTTVALEKVSSWLHLGATEWGTWALAGLLSGSILWILSGFTEPAATGVWAMAIAGGMLLILP